jgi:hypothetical protein
LRSDEQLAHCRVQGQVRLKAQVQHVEERYECNRSNDSTAHVQSAKTFERTALKTATPPRGCFRRGGTGCTRYGRVPVPAHTLYASGRASCASGWLRTHAPTCLVASMRDAIIHGIHRPNVTRPASIALGAGLSPWWMREFWRNRVFNNRPGLAFLIRRLSTPCTWLTQNRADFCGTPSSIGVAPTWEPSKPCVIG